MAGTDLVQEPFSASEFADNPEQRCPCLLLIDTSWSTRGPSITELNKGLIGFKDELVADAMAVKRVEIAVLAFGPIRLLSDFQTVDAFNPPHLEAENDTPLGEAIIHGVKLIEDRKKLYAANGISYYRPWIFLITDGAPNRDSPWQDAARLVHEGERAKKFMFFPVGYDAADMDVLRQISVRPPLRLRDVRFRDMFQWLASSLKSVSGSQVGQSVAIRDPREAGWAVVND